MGPLGFSTELRLQGSGLFPWKNGQSPCWQESDSSLLAFGFPGSYFQKDSFFLFTFDRMFFLRGQQLAWAALAMTSLLMNSSSCED